MPASLARWALLALALPAALAERFHFAAPPSVVSEFAPGLGVCYYPEQWPREFWETDAANMRALGLEFVRIAEFSWTLLEPEEGVYRFDFLDEAIRVLGDQGLKVVLGTPTATPPKWIIDRYPEVLPVGPDGVVRGFGSRRHYSFSSEVYRKLSRKIVTKMAERYGKNPHVVGWQIDNEFGCHATVRTYDESAKRGFQKWLLGKYGKGSRNKTEAAMDLNQRWGNAFWSMNYNGTDDVPLPFLTVTEANPIHRLDFFRYSSDALCEYSALQVDIVRRLSPGKFITHNYMGFFLDFDHRDLSKQLDFPSWDSYPLGFTDGASQLFSSEEKIRYSRTGHPDLASWHHTLYRKMSRNGKFWLMEQQPGGPVNWAEHNPSPGSGVLRLWAWEAFSHGADIVSFFRWRQFVSAQEQMHAGLLRPDSVPDEGFFEALQIHNEIKALWNNTIVPPPVRAKVAVVYDYQAEWVLSTIQPQGIEFNYLAQAYHAYSALRALGLDGVDIVGTDDDVSGYSLVVVPSLPMVSTRFAESLARVKGTVILGPRTGSKTFDFSIPTELPLSPEPLRVIAGGFKVVRVASVRPLGGEALFWVAINRTLDSGIWREWIELPDETKQRVDRAGQVAGFRPYPKSAAKEAPADAEEVAVQVVARFLDGFPAITKAIGAGGSRSVYYLAFSPTSASWDAILPQVVRELKLDAGAPLLKKFASRNDDDLRFAQRGGVQFALNYGATERNLVAEGIVPESATFVVGSSLMKPFDVAAWRL